MKHKLTIVLVLLGMFLITQLIGLYVVKHYSQDENKLPYGMDPPKLSEKEKTQFFPSIVLAFVIAIALFFLLTKFKVAFILKLWFFAVVIIALGISLNSFFPEYEYSHLIVLALAIPLAIFKVFKRNIIVHNATELLIYPGIAGVFVPLLNIWTMIALLVLISAYDMWAVWHSGIMQKMAKYQMNTLKVFGGFFVPYLSKKQRHQKKKIKINIAILGGGDVVFPIITAGVVMKIFGIWGALLIILGALLGLSYLFFISEKKKFYPAMPFITAGMFLMMIISWV